MFETKMRYKFFLLFSTLFFLTAGHVFATPHTYAGNNCKWPVGTTLNVYIAADPCAPPDRAQLAKEGIERWKAELAKRGITLNVNVGTAPAGTQNVIPVTWPASGTTVGTGSSAGTIGTDMDGYGNAKTDSDGKITSGDIKIVKGIAAADEDDENYIRNLAQHEMAHVLGLDHDPNGLVTNETLGEDANQMPNTTDLTELSTLYPIDASYTDGGPPAFDGLDEYPEDLYAKAIVTPILEVDKDIYTWTFTHSGPNDCHVPLIVMYGLDEELITDVIPPAGWELLNPADPLSKSPAYPYFDGRFIDYGLGFDPFSPDVRMPLAIRAMDEANTLTWDINPSVTLTVLTAGSKIGTIDIWAGGHGDTIEGPIWDDGYTVDDFEFYTDTPALMVNWMPTGTANVILSECYARQGLNAMMLGYNNVAPGDFSAVTHNYAIPQDWIQDGLATINIWLRFEDQAQIPVDKLYIELYDLAGMNNRVYLSPENTVPEQGGYLSIPLAEFHTVNFAEVSVVSFGIDNCNGITPDISAVYIDDIVIAPPVCSQDIKGDFNNDCIVNFRDFAEFSNNWLEISPLWP